MLPATWLENSTIQVKCRLFGVFPLVDRTLYFERIDGRMRQMQTREHDRLIRRWDHLISIREDKNGAHYSDTVEIEAGLLTWPICLFAKLFYRHRQRRWQRVTQRLNRSTA